IVAVAHKIFVIVYTLLKKGEGYQESGAAALDERQKDRILQRLQRRIAHLGYSVRLEPIDATAPSKPLVTRIFISVRPRRPRAPPPRCFRRSRTPARPARRPAAAQGCGCGSARRCSRHCRGRW